MRGGGMVANLRRPSQLCFCHSVRTNRWSVQSFNTIVRGNTDDTSRWTTKMIAINTYASSKTHRYDINKIKVLDFVYFACIFSLLTVLHVWISLTHHTPHVGLLLGLAVAKLWTLKNSDNTPALGPPCRPTIWFFFHFSIEFLRWSNTLKTWVSTEIVSFRPRDTQSKGINCLIPTVYSWHFATDTLLQIVWWIICGLHYTSSLWFKVSTVCCPSSTNNSLTPRVSLSLINLDSTMLLPDCNVQLNATVHLYSSFNDFLKSGRIQRARVPPTKDAEVAFWSTALWLIH